MQVMGKLMNGLTIFLNIEADITGAEFKALIREQLGDAVKGQDLVIVRGDMSKALQDTDMVIVTPHEGVYEITPYFQQDGKNIHLSGFGFGVHITGLVTASSVEIFSRSGSETDATVSSTKASEVPNSDTVRECVVSTRLSNGNSYFRFLNPASKNAGIIYPYEELRGSEVIDQTVPAKVKKAFNSNSYNVWNIVVGNHFDCNFFNQGTVQYGNPSSKGMLDYLIFPLIARKLMAHVLDDDIRLDLKTVLSKTLALCVAIPLEIARFGAGVALTLLLAPVAALLYLAKVCLPKNEAENTHSAPWMTV